MRGRMSRTAPGRKPDVCEPETITSEIEKSVKPRVDHGEDRVNLDKEMVKMAKASLHYNALSQVIKNNFDGIKTVITEGSRA